MAAREAELLPVPYFHVVFTLPAAIGDIAYQNKAVIYDLLFKASTRDDAHHCGRPKTPRSQDRHHRRAAHLGLGDDPSSARAHDRAGRRHLTWWRSLDCSAAQLLPAGAGALSAVPAADAGEACCRARGRQAHVLRQARALADAVRFAAFLAPLKKKRWFVYAKQPFAGPKAVLAYLSRYTHRVAISNGRLLNSRWQDGDLPRQELSCRGRCADIPR